MAKNLLDNPALEHRARTLPTTNASAEFILNSVVLAQSSQYVAEVDRFVSLPEAQYHEDVKLTLWKDSAVEKEKLLAALELLRQKSRTNETSRTEEFHQFTWKQVIAEVQIASDKYKNVGGRIKNIFQGMCNNAETFENWLSLLPDGDYGASISGAFVIIVRAARNISDVQQSIYETLACIPDTLSHANTYIEIYKAHSSEALVQKTADLCKSILISLQLIIQFFLKSSFKRGFVAVLKGNAFEKELKESIQNMKNQVLKLREEANICLQKRISEMDRKNDLRAFREQYRQQLAKEELFLAIDRSTEITAQKVCTYLLRQLQSSPDFNVRTGGHNLTSGSPLQVVHKENVRSKMGARKREGPTSQQLLEMLEYDDNIHQNDIRDSLTFGYTQSETDRARSMWALYSTEMGEFLAGKPESKLLLINGNSEATEFVSPLSFACAKISDLISVSNQIMLATYFCGRHTDELRDSKANAKGMLASLVGQLLVQVRNWENDDSELDFLSVSDDNCNAIQQGDLDALFDIFRVIVKQLPKHTLIFCLIDSLSAYENSDRREDTISIMQKLVGLVRKTKHNAFKLLVTCPGQSISMNRWAAFDSRRMQVLNVPEDL